MGVFRCIKGIIYPKENGVKQHTKNLKRHNKFIYGCYDKGDEFNFNVVNFPNLLGNIPTKQP